MFVKNLENLGINLDILLFECYRFIKNLLIVSVIKTEVFNRFLVRLYKKFSLEADVC